MPNARHVVIAILLSSPCLTSATSAQARTQPPPVPIPPVEVVATRRPEAPHEVPASIEVISGEDLRARGATSLRDALSLAAGVAIAPGGDQGPAGSVPEFWGLREFDAFLLVVDDVPWGGALNPDVATVNLEDVQRIEILRGPAPVTYGATSFVGVIHVVHNAAAASTRHLRAHGGSYGSGGIAGDYAFPTTGSWKSRITGDFDHLGYKDDRTSYSRGHGLWRIAKTETDRNMWLNADVTILRQEPASPHPREGPALSSKVPLDANANPANARLDNDRFTLSAGYERPLGKTITWGSTASFAHSSQDIFRGFLTDLTNTPNNASGFKEKIDINDLYVDSHITWPAGSSVRFLTGADLLVAAGEAKGAVFTYTAPLDGSRAASVPEPAVLDRDAEDERRFLGGYGSLEWRPTSRVNLSGGLRINATTEKRGEGEEVTHTRLSGSLGALFGLWEQGANHVRLFANYRDTFKPAAFDFGLAENEGVLDPETSRSYEGGVKVMTMDGRFDLEASLFRMDFTNLVTATIVNNLPALINSGKTRFKGFELASDAHFPNDVTARATYSFHDGKFVDFVQDFDGTLTQLGGKRFEMSARQLASAGVFYAPAHGLIVSANMNYTGDRFLNKRNTALAPAFSTFDAGIGYRASRFEVRIDGRNLGDRRDAVAESEFGDAQYYRMPARTIQAGIALHY